MIFCMTASWSYSLNSQVSYWVFLNKGLCHNNVNIVYCGSIFQLNSLVAKLPSRLCKPMSDLNCWLMREYYHGCWCAASEGCNPTWALHPGPSQWWKVGNFIGKVGGVSLSKHTRDGGGVCVCVCESVCVSPLSATVLNGSFPSPTCQPMINNACR